METTMNKEVQEISEEKSAIFFKTFDLLEDTKVASHELQEFY